MTSEIFFMHFEKKKFVWLNKARLPTMHILYGGFRSVNECFSSNYKSVWQERFVFLSPPQSICFPLAIIRNNKMRHIISIIILFLIVSCKNENIKFPFNEKELIQNKMYGELLEYAMYNTTKIDFVNSILCDTLKNNSDLIFSKIESRINDSTYYFFHLHEYEPIINDYIGMIYIDINKFDSIHMYSFDNNFKYSSNEFIKVILEIAEHNKSTVEKTMKHRKINNKFIPNFYFVVMVDFATCDDEFVRRFIHVNKQINSMMTSCSKKIFKNEKVEIEPYIEITSGFTEIYKSRFNYKPLPEVNENKGITN